MKITTQFPHLPDSFTLPRHATQPKSIASSKTFWGTVFTTATAIAPIIKKSVDTGKFTGSDLAQIVVDPVWNGRNLSWSSGSG